MREMRFDAVLVCRGVCLFVHGGLLSYNYTILMVQRHINESYIADTINMDKSSFLSFDVVA